ncbi:hypothetical protein LCGC14_3090170 [marine sediment metagenome]|uniref:Uncharacterized protein n=1 Tax=marine sediment metagenome TaxID=412755 RepID=A0A0F8WBC3_9ZZZZ
MEFVIKNADTGDTAKVDGNKNLHVLSRSHDSREIYTFLESHFSLHAICHLETEASGAFMMVEYTGSKLLMIKGVRLSAHTLTDGLIIQPVKNPSTTSNGTNVSKTNIIQKRFSSGENLEAVLTISDNVSDIDFTNGEPFDSEILKSEESVKFDDVSIIKKGDIYLVSWATLDGLAAIDAELVDVTIDCIEITESDVI